ncbi:vesicle transporter [Capsaspora owczarzaki ATCC 30864]|uniref:Vesicle transporter n=2 Tax=Capsaspora owczarzaki (strain ATCC 30864) TaxID=595528 RepID=A0A0D2UF28_CAPO3|nr:vesicle transporter [Capsaspora owczarzaki ATCC 30864]
MSMRDLTHERIMDGVIRRIKPENNFKILVLDHLSTRVISSVCRMYDIMDEGVTLVENIAKKRRAFRQYEAIYLVSPTEQSVNAIIADFDKQHVSEVQYKKAHIFFTSMCPDALFKKLSSCKALVQFLGTLEEIYVEFLPAESQAFSLDSPQSFHSFYSPHSANVDPAQRRIADQIATLCATLGENPVIRYSTTNEQNMTLATYVQARIDQYLAAGSIVPTSSKRSQLFLVDRSVDLVSPMLHELTYQAMAYDLLPIVNDVYDFKFSTGNGRTETKPVIIGESDRLWPDLRHRHIADAIRDVSDGFKKFLSQSKAGALSKTEKVSLGELSEALKEMPQHQDQMQRYSLHVHIAERCMEFFKELQLESIARVEQNMVMGEDEHGEPIKNIIPELVPLMQDSKISPENKLRLLTVYTLTREGLLDSELQKFMEHSNLPPKLRKAMENLIYLGAAVSTNDKRTLRKYKRRERSEETSYALSRWVPVLKDMLEDILEDKVDKNFFASVRDENVDSSADAGAAASVRSTKSGWAKTNKDKREGKDAASSSRKTSETKTGPRLIVFFMGGITYSELRAAYEVNDKSKREIIVGGTHFTTANQYIENLGSLDKAAEAT